VLQVFDDTQLTAMTRAIDQIMNSAGPKSTVRRTEVAHAVFTTCAESGVGDPSTLAKMALERLGRARTKRGTRRVG
jgi:hypothetical protein